MTREPRILIVDDDHYVARTLVDILNIRGFQAQAVNSGLEALDAIKQARFDCIIADITMPGMNGVELYQGVQKIQPEVPAILMTAYADDELIKAGLAKGIIAVLPKPLNIYLLLEFLSFLKDARNAVVIDDEPNICEMLGDMLRLRDITVLEITDPQDTDKAIGRDTQVVLLDMKLNGITGLDVLKQIRAQYPRLPVILVTGHRKEMSAALDGALKLDVHACLYKPVSVKELLDVVDQIYRERLSHLLTANYV